MPLEQKIQQLRLLRVRYSRQTHHALPYSSQTRWVHQSQSRSFRSTSRRLTGPPNRSEQTNPPKPTSTTSPPSTATTSARLSRILDRLPAPLKKYTSRLRAAPLSHVVAFLILHELTAIVPLLSLFGLFHYTSSSSSSTIPIGYMLEHYGSYVRDGVLKFERYFTRKEWFGFERGQGEDANMETVQEKPTVQGQEKEKEDVLRRWESSDGKYRVLVEVALAYALTKALLPTRIVVSVWATPWFAGVLARLRNIRRPR